MCNEEKIRSHLSRSAEEMLEAGQALVVSRNCLLHEEWLNFLSPLDLECCVAQRIAQAAV
ncbi:hypothetical protein DAECLI1_30280 [Escherichia coli]|nr:hypothetical protein DAECLI1_30280 [Escherichia coli]